MGVGYDNGPAYSSFKGFETLAKQSSFTRFCRRLCSMGIVRLTVRPSVTVLQTSILLFRSSSRSGAACYDISLLEQVSVYILAVASVLHISI